MTAQPQTLFDQPATRTVGKPGSHRADPLTSYIAAEKLAKSGKWAKQKQEVYDALKEATKAYTRGATSAEVGTFMEGINSRFVAARRLPELEKDGLVVRSDSRQCCVTGNPSGTWKPKEQR